MWGRNVYDSISKFLQFQLTVNVVAVTIAFVSICIISDTPLKTVQMLWVNLIMDTLASLALATEAPTRSLLHRQPYGRTMPLLSTVMLRNILGQAAFMVVVIFLLLFYGHLLVDIDDGLYASQDEPPSQHFTLIFNTFVMMTLFNEVNARKIHGEHNVFQGITNNPLFYCIWLVTFAAQVVIVQFGSFAFSTAALTFDQWLWCVFFGVLTLLWGQLITTAFSSIQPRAFRSSATSPSREDSGWLSPDSLQTRFMQKKRDAHVFWIQSLTDLQTQIRVVRAFKSGVVEPLEEEYNNDDDDQRQQHQRHDHEQQQQKISRRRAGGGLVWPGGPPPPTSNLSLLDNSSLDVLLDPETASATASLPQVDGAR
ncbi:hypothetical protein Pcinc_021367 [Petrolisthes cinctipes]|uniref:Cation-transporting P-type ATPase C-terminal domain-containing protein n=1 Tax=Petrolisthes cinctipes TaxID=88211 RepID=A0AAE1FG25_PETCI|nr:hypothetical protein Pcinc_021367 [Petrolisthes cinctipes]